jgi:hypothetical protein
MLRHEGDDLLVAKPLEVINADVDATAAELARALSLAGSEVGRLCVGERHIGTVNDNWSKARIREKR